MIIKNLISKIEFIYHYLWDYKSISNLYNNPN